LRSIDRWRGLPRRILRVLARAAGGAPQRGRVVLYALLLANGIPSPFSADDALVLGVFPHLTAKKTIEVYRPLADTLEKHLRRQVVIHSARDFKTFVERTRQGKYDILLTAPHLAWLARQEAGYRPLLKYAQPARGMLVVRADSKFDSTEALRGRTIAIPDPIAVAVLALQAELAAHGLRHGTDYRTIETGTHINAVMQVINRRTDGAILGLHAFALMSPELHRQLRVIAETRPLSSLMYLSHPHLRDTEAQAIREALLDFAATPEGRTFMQRGSYGGFAEVDGDELQAFRPYALQAQEILRKNP
jgi:phosphonate transport system substrate-binding protein